MVKEGGAKSQHQLSIVKRPCFSMHIIVSLVLTGYYGLLNKAVCAAVDARCHYMESFLNYNVRWRCRLIVNKREAPAAGILAKTSFLFDF